jgi:hypothetical protein
LQISHIFGSAAACSSLADSALLTTRDRFSAACAASSLATAAVTARAARCCCAAASLRGATVTARGLARCSSDVESARVCRDRVAASGDTSIGGAVGVASTGSTICEIGRCRAGASDARNPATRGDTGFCPARRLVASTSNGSASSALDATMT